MGTVNPLPYDQVTYSPDQQQGRPGGVDRAAPDTAQLRLDDLLAELQGRLQAVMNARDRVHGLLEAVVAVGSNLELEAMLRRIVEAAVTLVDARYGALGVVGEDGRLGGFHPGWDG